MSEEREMSIEDLENIDGGIIVQSGGTVYVVDDETGDTIYTSNNLTNIKQIAAHRGVSPEKISKGEYQKRFGRRL